jgi:glutamyl-tRNA synthetase
MHLGNARTFFVAWLAIRSTGGRLIMRIEDIDRQRVMPLSESALVDDLRWLGLDWDEGPDGTGEYGPYRQSERLSLYREALEKLRLAGRAFPCACSRAELESAASAPHGDGDGPVYPGTCRNLGEDEVVALARKRNRNVAWRFRASEEPLRFSDAVFGPQQKASDDFVLMRADGVPSYQLAVTVDDLAMGITQVVRGADLLGSTARQLALINVLGGNAPSYAHVPLVLSPEGTRLAKRNRPTALRDLRQQGVSASALRAQLGRSLGIPCGAEVEPLELVTQFSFDRLSTQEWCAT